MPTTRVIGQQLHGFCSSLRSAISPISKFLVILYHFCLSWRLPKNSLHRLDQNLFTICSTRLHRFWVYKSGDSNLPGGCMTTLDFIDNKLEGDKSKKLVTSLMVSTVPDSPHMTSCWWVSFPKNPISPMSF